MSPSEITSLSTTSRLFHLIFVVYLSNRYNHYVFNSFTRYLKVICLLQQNLNPGWTSPFLTQVSHLTHLFPYSCIRLLRESNHTETLLLHVCTLLIQNSWILHLIDSVGVIIHPLNLSVSNLHNSALIILWRVH